VRGASDSFRDAVSTLDQLASATENDVSVQAVLQLLGAVEEEALFRLCLVVDRDTAGALTFLEELAEQGEDLGRLVVDLLEHLRHLMLQHMGEVPDTPPVTEETRERLRAQANQLGEATLIRLVDLLPIAVEDMRQGGDPRLPVELALVKVTRPGSGSLPRVALLPPRTAGAATPRERCGDAYRRGGGAAVDRVSSPHTLARARAAPGGVAAHDPARRGRALDPGSVGMTAVLPPRNCTFV
jgi:DNA polymerase-3 subunit gamma/tau